MQKNKKLIVITAAVLLVLVTAALLLIRFTSAKTEEGVKQITVTVVHKDGTQKNLKLKTEKEYLGDVLLCEELVTEDEYKTGFYTVVDGEKADYNADGGWWNITDNGKSSMLGVNVLPIVDGGEYEIVYTCGYVE